MMLAGLFDKFQNLQVISGHWGEMVPFYLQRMDDMIPPDVSGLSRTISDTYRAHVSVTPSGMLNLPHFEFINAVLGAERIIYSVDYPYLSHTGARAFLENLSIDQAAKEKIAHGNAEALMFRS
jgi:predicted TIM-barrel fold metal-dependent hydrolase